ncbi:MAG: helicase-related protein [Gemmatimonadales bacterium]
MASAIEQALVGCRPATETPPAWLLPHQRFAFQRLVSAIQQYRGALLADAVGLGKTFVGLAVARRYARPCVVCPAALRAQWRHRAAQLAVSIHVVSSESLSRHGTVPHADLAIVDEAHRFRNPATIRYRTLATGIADMDVLLLSATPMVNSPADLGHLLRLFLADNAMAHVGLSSIEHAPGAGALWNAARVLIVARRDVPGVHIPHVTDHTVRVPAVDPPIERALLAAIEGLRFPDFADRSASKILRCHMLHRLNSSLEALADTVNRHERYVVRAINRAKSGQRITRRSVQALIKHEAATGQLDLLANISRENQPAAVDVQMLRRELDSLQQLLQLVGNAAASPKLAALKQRLHDGSKTIVFTTAQTTARAVARALGWRRLAVVTGQGARIAKGRIDAQEVYDRFSPRSRNGAIDLAIPIDVLIATDVASEGLDLQDANQIVHFDLPWTPERLTQRLGRIARIGSPHESLSIVWILPTEDLERRSRLESILASKSSSQTSGGVVTTARAGHSNLVGSAQIRREELLGAKPAVTHESCTTVTDGCDGVIVLEWQINGGITYDVFAIDDEGTSVAVDDIVNVLGRLRGLASRAGPVPGWANRVLHEVVAARIARAYQPPANTARTKLARRLVALGAIAGKKRNLPLLAELDDALTHLNEGQRVGYELLVEDWLNAIEGDRDHRSPPIVRGPHPDLTIPRVAWAVLGSGT